MNKAIEVVISGSEVERKWSGNGTFGAAEVGSFRPRFQNHQGGQHLIAARQEIVMVVYGHAQKEGWHERSINSYRRLMSMAFPERYFFEEDDSRVVNNRSPVRMTGSKERHEKSPSRLRNFTSSEQYPINPNADLEEHQPDAGTPESETSESSEINEDPQTSSLEEDSAHLRATIQDMRRRALAYGLKEAERIDSILKGLDRLEESLDEEEDDLESN